MTETTECDTRWRIRIEDGKFKIQVYCVDGFEIHELYGPLDKLADGTLIEVDEDYEGVLVRRNTGL